ncbi:T9SS C-terminal target domain-containing protein [Chryseobacterium nematophagum]|uniref:T9SS C-terminal target domain-containing protein n=1 Tax=Chryseobacterium nematophagum TaxID=2305228 RepID=A0A3M7LG79_9FLAO|nr:T9SS type A sorting domain-containing protein [Chryseobacterium nematophagum]RMZ61179.1 T9SS C-terminal target domain-containing protein [Chryseobacterium nematophagum]
MKKAFTFIMALAIFSLFNPIHGQTFQTLSIQSGFTADVIANGFSNASNSSTALDENPGGDNHALYSTDFLPPPTTTLPIAGLPINRIINVTSIPGLSFQLASYSSNNSMRLSGTNSSGTFTLSTPTTASSIYILATSGNQQTSAAVTIHFIDNSTQVFSPINVPDWVFGGASEIPSLGRVNRVNNQLTPGIAKLYPHKYDIDPNNQSKPIQSVTIVNSSGGGILNVFALTAEKSSNLSINEVSSKPENTIYPNPFTNILNIKKVKDIQHISILDLSGIVIKRIKNPSSVLNLEDLKPGVYMLEFTMRDNSLKSAKVIKK